MAALIDGPRLIGAHEAPDLAGVPAGTVRRWASEGDVPVLAARGLDVRGRPLYDLADVLQLRARPRRQRLAPTCAARHVDSPRDLPNTRADGTRASEARQ